MNSSDADRQIQHMIAFIQQEAKEKAEEIRVKTESAFTAEKLNLTMQMSYSIREEFERKQKDRLIQKKIERSKLVNNARMATMKERDTKIKQIKKEILARMVSVSKNPKYPDLIRLLIVEALMAVHEDKCWVQCRKADEAIVKGQLDAAAKQYCEIMKKASGQEVKVTLQLDTKDYLPAAPVEKEERDSCCGGVVVHANGKKLICRNTLDSRLELAFSDLKPVIRGMLFGFREAAKTSKSEEKKH